MRETRYRMRRGWPSKRITPAYAGNTIQSVKRIWLQKDHPRVCGKHLGVNIARLPQLGSPPRMRETHFSSCFFVIMVGITPAFAGKNSSFQDHPRVCGKHLSKSVQAYADAGSPPRMRETRTLYLMSGKPVQDHPRVCGKHSTFLGSMRYSVGSPPRMRETQFMRKENIKHLRITPAYAGNTFQNLYRHMLTRDHPRVCGKHDPEDEEETHALGSPPRMRETQFMRKENIKHLRITPAYAGNTSTWSTFKAAYTDHPRVCGKHFAVASEALSTKGSPPRMRETLPFCSSPSQLNRITPAYAGNT